MENEKIAVELEHHRNEIQGLKHRMEAVERGKEVMERLTSSVNELAINMKYMVDEQKHQGKRLETLEAEPAERLRYWRRTVVTAVVTTAIGLLVGAVAARFL